MPIEEVSIATLTQVRNSANVLIDVREPEEYESGHVSGAINIPLSEFASRIFEIPNSSVFFICRSGGRSMQACELCVDFGLTEVKNVAGGTLAWVSAGNDVVVGGSPG